MEFERARTKEQFQRRQLDIMDACEKLYDEEGYEGVNFKKLSETTSIKRSTIYNYYTAKEEVLIDILAREMDIWKNELLSYMEGESSITEENFAEKTTESLVSHPRLLKLYSILFTLLEPNCKVEKLAEFKVIALKTSETLCKYIGHFNPKLSQEKVELAANQIICYVLGLYPMTHINENQKKALDMIDIPYEVPDFATMCTYSIRSFV